MLNDYLLPTVISLSNMIREMNRKKLDLGRISKTASLLLLSGLSPNSIPKAIIDRCLDEQQQDGGWIATGDTAWNAFLLKCLDSRAYTKEIGNALDFIRSQESKDGLWGRSKRDNSRIPVTGLLFFQFPNLANNEKLLKLEKLWTAEKNSLVYKAGYTLMAFKAAGYTPYEKNLLKDTLQWLCTNQEKNGGFAPWKGHPAPPDVFCTSIAVMGLLQYKEAVPPEVFREAYRWLTQTRLPNGIWPFHEIEDGASWGLLALTGLLQNNLDTDG